MNRRAFFSFITLGTVGVVLNPKVFLSAPPPLRWININHISPEILEKLQRGVWHDMIPIPASSIGTVSREYMIRNRTRSLPIRWFDLRCRPD